MLTQRLKLRGRAQTYGLVIGVVMGMLIAGLAFPLITGTPTPETFRSSTPTTASALAQLSSTDEQVGVGANGEVALPRTAGPGGTTVALGPARPGAASLPAGTKLTASDRGVTPTTIKVGVMISDVRGELASIGVDLGAFDPDAEEAAWKAYIAEVNSRGGILGRKIIASYKRWDSEEAYYAKCRELTKDEKVFSVFSANFIIGEPNLCVTREGRTPMVAFAADSTKEVYRDSKGYLSTGLPHNNRMATSFAYDANRIGLLKGKRIGVLIALDPDTKTPGEDFVATLKALKVPITHISRLSADDPLSQIPGEVQQMKAKDVQLVLLAANWLSHHTPFVQNAESQLFFPDYATSELLSSTEDVAAQGMPQSYDGAIGIQFSRSGDWRTGKPEPAPDKRCREIYEKGTGEALPRENDDLRWLVMGACGVVQRFEAAGALAGATLTRDRLSSAIQSLGKVNIPHTGGGSFGPGKFDGADFVRTKRYSYDCRCYQVISGFRSVPPS